MTLRRITGASKGGGLVHDVDEIQNVDDISIYSYLHCEHDDTMGVIMELQDEQYKNDTVVQSLLNSIAFEDFIQRVQYHRKSRSMMDMIEMIQIINDYIDYRRCAVFVEDGLMYQDDTVDMDMDMDMDTVDTPPPPPPIRGGAYDTTKHDNETVLHGLTEIEKEQLQLPDSHKKKPTEINTPIHQLTSPTFINYFDIDTVDNFITDIMNKSREFNPELGDWQHINSWFLQDALFIRCIECIFGIDISYNPIGYDTIYNMRSPLYRVPVSDNSPITQKGGDRAKSNSTLIREAMNTVVLFEELPTLAIIKTIKLKDSIDNYYNAIVNAIGYIQPNINPNVNPKIKTVVNKTMMVNINRWANTITNITKNIPNNSNPRKTDRLNNQLNQLVADIRVYVENGCLKHIENGYRTNDIKLDTSSADSAPSNETKTITRGFLKTLVGGISKISGNAIENDESAYKKLYDKQDNILGTISLGGGRIPTTIDNELITTFDKCVPALNKKIIKVDPKNGQANDVVLRNVINNSMAAKTTDKGRVVDLTNSWNVICPMSSILDAQGAFGSCNKGVKSRGYISGNQNITMMTVDGSDPMYEFGMSVVLKKQGQQQGNKVVATYYVIYGNFDSTECSIDTIVSDKNITILSANNTFKNLLNYFEVVFSKRGAVDWELFDTDNTDNFRKLVQVASQKAFGDGAQEDTAMADKGGYIDGNQKFSDSTRSILFASGDRPSTVRAAYILLNSSKGCNKSASVLYGGINSTSLQLYYNPDNKKGGSTRQNAQRHQRHRRTSKPRTQRHRRTSKPRTQRHRRTSKPRTQRHRRTSKPRTQRHRRTSKPRTQCTRRHIHRKTKRHTRKTKKYR